MSITTEYQTVIGAMTRLWGRFTARRRHQCFLVLVLVLISALAEVVSLGMVLPFIAILTAPDRMLSGYPLVGKVASLLGSHSAQDILLAITAAFIIAAVCAAAIRTCLLWVTTGLANAIVADVSIEIYRRTLYQPYRVHVARNSAEMITGISHRAEGVGTVLQSVLMLATSIAMLVMIMLALLAINAAVAMIAMLGFGIGYGAITWLVRKRIEVNSHIMKRESIQTLKALQEGLGAIRDVLLDGTQPVYCDIFRRANHPLRRAQANNTFISGCPRFAMEALGISLIAALACTLSYAPGGAGTTLPVLGALALAAQRLLPAAQQIYAAWTAVSSNRAIVVDVLDLLDQPLSEDALRPAPPPLRFKRDVVFEDVSFRYADDGPWTLDRINVRIAKGSRVGFVGATGGGKSTALDIYMGLIEPTHGRVVVDGETLEGERRRAWQRTIAHVPQSIYLADVTLAENIAFGVPRQDIDMQRVRDAARRARISDFIESTALGYNALIGERGIRLSGGQRQRVGVARALYKQATILVFDEATSALDNATEQEIVSSVKEISDELTMLIVAHRLTTVRNCDVIFEFVHGRVVAQGTYDQLLEASPSFRHMVTAEHA